MSLRIVCLVVGLALSAAAVRGDEPGPWLDKHVAELVSLYKEFHQMPELSFQEEKTAAKLATELRHAGLETTTGVGGHGVVGVLKNGDGPTVMFRCDLDALPVTEETGLPYASTMTATADEGLQVGVMHACGHDIHITNLIGIARYLAENREQWQGTLLLIGQPAEERVDGAEAMLKDGLYTRFPKPQFALALHVESDLPTGQIGYRAGYALANSDACDITVRGKGGHGSKPEACIDPIIQAAELVVALQSIVSREVSPLDPAVVTVGAIQGGTKHNIISDHCHLKLTIRSYSPEVRQQLREAIERKAKAVAASHRAPEPIVKFKEGTSAVFNDEGLVQRVVGGFVDELGNENVVPVERVMGAEDFGEYAVGGVPIFMFRLGTIPPRTLEKYRESGATPPSLHSALYYPDPEPTLRTGIRASVAAIRELMPRH